MLKHRGASNNKEFFEKVIELRQLDNWNSIDELMRREFMSEWDNFIGVNNL